MVEILLSLAGVIVGGAIGLGGTYLQTRNQRYILRREEVLPIAGRALAAAEETYHVAGESAKNSPTSPDQNLLDFLEADDLTEFVHSHQKLRIALHELSLLMRDLEDESRQLRQSVSAWNARTVEPWDRQKIYEQAREAFIARVRQHLGT